MVLAATIVVLPSAVRSQSLECAVCRYHRAWGADRWCCQSDDCGGRSANDCGESTAFFGDRDPDPPPGCQRPSACSSNNNDNDDFDVNGGSTFTVAIGSSPSSKSKDAQFRNEGYNNIACPNQVTKSNWVRLASHYDDYGDTFAITVSQASKTITATRTDYNGGWGMDLRFTCTYSGTGPTCEEGSGASYDDTNDFCLCQKGAQGCRGDGCTKHGSGFQDGTPVR